MIHIFPDDTGGSSFESFDDIGYWFGKGGSEVEVNMIFFHSHSYDGNIEFFTDSFDYLFDGTLEII
jgi:hypothetical protein